MNTKGWIGVDLDGTLATYHGWGDGIGKPIKPMVDRIKHWLSLGIEVRIMTARAYSDGTTRMEHQLAETKTEIETWCLKHIGVKLPITCQKDYNMIQLWDDRAVAIEPNTGRRLGGYEGYDVGDLDVLLESDD